MERTAAWHGVVSGAAGACLVAMVPVLCGAQPVEDFQARRQRAVAEGERLLAEGRYEEAISTSAPWGREMGEWLLNRAKRTRAEGRPAAALRDLRAYLDYFPFDGLDWREQYRRWDQAACHYLDLAGETGLAEGDEAVIQGRATRKAWQRLRELALPDNPFIGPTFDAQDQVFALADEIVVNFPRSPFAPAAALTASLAALYGPSGDGKGTTTNHEWIVSRLKAYLEKMKGGGAPARARILLLLEIVKWSNMGDTEGFERALAAWQEIARITTLAHEKRRALIGAAHAALHIKRPESLEQARALCRQILKTYPDAPEVDEACRVLVLTHLAAKQPHEALRVLRGLQEEAPRGADLARPLRDIALHLSETKRDPQAVVLLKEVVQRYPASPLVPEAYFLMGEAYGRLGDEPRMVEAYQKATGLASAKGAVAPHQAYGVAFERLGEHYMRKENWAEALKWWQAWNPRSWCVTCQAGMQSRRTSMIALCRRRLGPFDDPVKRAQWAIRATTIGAVLVSGLLVVLWAEDARRRMKLRKMRAPKHLA